MVMPNLYGNIVNNVCAGLVGGPGLVAGANYGHAYAVFETVSAIATAACPALSTLWQQRNGVAVGTFSMPSGDPAHLRYCCCDLTVQL